jgi:ribonuclease P protein component
MIGKNQRISKNRVAWLLKKSQKWNDEFFSVKFQLNKHGLNRYSIVVSKKTLKLATDRNLLRRQCYEVLRQLKTQNNSIDFLIFIKPSALKLDFTGLQEQLTQTIEKITSKSNSQNGQKSS